MEEREHELGAQPQILEAAAEICMPATDSGLVQIGESEADEELNTSRLCEHGEPVEQLSRYREERTPSSQQGEPGSLGGGVDCSDQASRNANPVLPLQDISRIFWGWEENIAKNSSTEASPRRFSRSANEGEDDGAGARDVERSPEENVTKNEQSSSISQNPALDRVPFAISYPSYCAHLRYEIRLTKRFWSCDLHHRDWRQVFVSSYFPNLIDVASLVVIRLFLCVVLLVLEVLASRDVKKDLGWPMLLYFTNWNSYLTTIYFCLLCFLSVRAAWSFRTPLISRDVETERIPDDHSAQCYLDQADEVNENELPSVNASLEMPAKVTGQSQKRTTKSRISTRASTESQQSRHKYPHRHYNPSKGPWGCFCIHHRHIAPALPPHSTIRRKLVDCVLLPGYHELMSHEVYCVEGILLAPNPSYPESLAWTCFRKKNASAKQDAETKPDASKQESDTECSERPRTPLLVSIVWVLHSVHLVASVGVCVIFFSLLNQNGNTFPESWYSVWKHLMIVVVTLMHSLLLSRIPIPIRHVVFEYIFIMIYLALQVVVFLLDLPNGDGGHGYIYRVFDMRCPGRAFGVAILVLASIAVLTLALWSASRQRSLFVDPPPSVAVSASTLLEIRTKQLAAKLHELHLSVDCGVGDCSVDAREPSRQLPVAVS
uniref:Transmembrane protein n=1 Tax=Neospora caninum (strain Liverpool) TaxID=572307 RepID=A0A0F7UPG6_NEOCL|nr:TPA: hypothetical protein BN1204_065810 [Neospora caninum Liverpool]